MSNEILLNDLLNLSEVEMKKAKIKFNIWNGSVHPIDEYLADHDIVNNQWLFWRNKRGYFTVGQIAICLVQMSADKWLLTTIKKVTKELNVVGGINYEGDELSEYQSYYGRVVISYHKDAQQMCRFYDTVANEMIVNQILPAVYDGINFPGYDNVYLTFTQLKNIIETYKTDWINALSNQKAVYLLTDNETGKLYVGSATSKTELLLSRWRSYIENGHGGNVLLKQLVSQNGLEYIEKNFTFTLLENFNASEDDAIILARESWWKNVLATRKFGYNDN